MRKNEFFGTEQCQSESGPKEYRLQLITGYMVQSMSRIISSTSSEMKAAAAVVVAIILASETTTTTTAASAILARSATSRLAQGAVMNHGDISMPYDL